MTPAAPTVFPGTADGGSRPAAPVLIAVAESPQAAELAVKAGADIIDLCLCGAEDAWAFLTRHPAVAFCADALPGPGRAPSLTHLRERAAPGTALICQNLAEARHSGLPAELIVVITGSTGLADVIQAGYAPCVDVDPAVPNPHAAGALADRDALPPAPGGQTAAGDHPVRAAAAAALAAWSGARLIRTRQVTAVRRAIDMTSSVAGIRPPVRAVRGLA